MTDTMTTGDHPPTIAGRWTAESARWTRSRLRGAAQRRSIPRLLLGVLLVLACVGGFVWISTRTDHRDAVLALARDVRIGQVLAAEDLREVLIAVDVGVAVVHAHETTTVVGRSVATSLPAGSLLAPGALSSASVPGAGQGIAALPLKPGRFPPGLAAGSSVSLVLAPDQPSGDVARTASAAWSAVVIEVSPSPGDHAAVVAVVLGEAAAREVAAVPAGHLAVVLLPSGGR